MHFIIFDLEATCWAGNQDFRQQEIIEIGAIKTDHFGQRISEFQAFVRPELFPDLSPYCVKLTGIEQSDVDIAKDFRSVARQFAQWANGSDERILFCSWGSKDQELIQGNCAIHDMNEDWFAPYIDLKSQYHQINGLGRTSGLKKSLRRENIEFQGSHHRAMDDAANLYTLFLKYRDVWMY